MTRLKRLLSAISSNGSNSMVNARERWLVMANAGQIRNTEGYTTMRLYESQGMD